ncbi:MAG: DUF362 domain-containing protein [Candidatus Hodarchaeales archaeon]|jgi:uncharacterized protein (DUF362 family)
MVIVSVIQNKDVKLAVQKVISLLGGIESFVRPQDKVIIKPNLVVDSPSDTGVTTDPRVVQAIVELCKRVNPSNITIAEGSGGVNTNIAFERCGYSEIAQRCDVNLLDLNESQTTSVDVPNGKAITVFNIPNIILESDVLINVPKLKLYSLPWASLSVKNLLGTVPGKGEYSQTSSPEFPIKLSNEYLKSERKGPWFGPRGEKQRVHTKFDEAIVDLNTVIQPALTVIDGIIAGYGKKFATGAEPREFNTILASRDPLALDYITTKLGGLNPLEISYLKHAAEREVGESDYNQIQVVGTPLDKIEKDWKNRLNNSQMQSDN